MEIRALQHNAGGGRPNRAMQSADHARQRDGAFGVGDHQIRRTEVVALIVQRDDPFTWPGAPNKDRWAMQLGSVERMHRLRQLRHDVIRYVDNVVDSIQSDGFQAILQPHRRRLHCDIFKNQCAVSWAESEILDLDSDRRLILRQNQPSPDLAISHA